MEVIEYLKNMSFRSEIGIVTALLASYLLYFVFHKKDELGKHAAQNTAATMVIIGVNLGVTILFLNDLNRLAQSAYAALHIPRLPADFWDGTPLWLLVILGILARDFADYWNHRVMHTRWGWPTHAAHHSDTHVNAFTLYRVHFLEVIVMMAGHILLLTWLQMPEAIPFVAVFSLLHGQYVHMDLPFTHGPFRLVLASPVFHRWHHADVPEAYGKNLANMIPFYDWIFGTYYNPGQCTAPMGALDSGVADKDPLAILLYPFREWRKMIRRRLKRRAKAREARLAASSAATQVPMEPAAVQAAQHPAE